MAFRANDSQQISFSDTLYGLTAREQKALERSWAKVFAEDIFPAIDESRFSVLYSEKASRPNTPVNVIIGALILKELFDLSDDEVVEDLLLDPRFQYALHTTSFEEQPISDKTLTRFRQRCYDYERLYNIDLYHDCVTDLAARTARLMKIDGRIRRMDSLMVAANIRTLSRMELIYRCIAGMTRWLKKQGEVLPESLQHYNDPDDYNRVIYHSRSTDAAVRMAMLLADADALLMLCGSRFEEVTEYQLLTRCLSEQTVVREGKRELLSKEDHSMGSAVLQNPSDPDATFRVKAGKKHRGYTANVEESVGKAGSVVTDYQFETNNTGDSRMLRDKLEETPVREKETLLITDGAYAGEENVRLAAEKNITLVTTDLPGRDVDPVKGQFVLNEEGTRVLKCPMGLTPRSTSFIRQTGMCTASFDREHCANCPYRDRCHAKVFKRVAKITVSVKQIRRAQMQAFMKSGEFKAYARLRNGVETIPSSLRKNYRVDRMPVRGRVRSKFFFGAKIAALNFRKLLTFYRGQGHYAQNPLLAGAKA